MSQAFSVEEKRGYLAAALRRRDGVPPSREPVSAPKTGNEAPEEWLCRLGEAELDAMIARRVSQLTERICREIGAQGSRADSSECA